MKGAPALTLNEYQGARLPAAPLDLSVPIDRNRSLHSVRRELVEVELRFCVSRDIAREHGLLSTSSVIRIDQHYAPQESAILVASLLKVLDPVNYNEAIPVPRQARLKRIRDLDNRDLDYTLVVKGRHSVIGHVADNRGRDIKLTSRLEPPELRITEQTYQQYKEAFSAGYVLKTRYTNTFQLPGSSDHALVLDDFLVIGNGSKAQNLREGPLPFLIGEIEVSGLRDAESVLRSNHAMNSLLRKSVIVEPGTSLRELLSMQRLASEGISAGQIDKVERELKHVR